MMRRVFCLILTFMLLLAFAACSGGRKGEDIPSGDSEVSSTPKSSQTEQETSSTASAEEPGPSSPEPQEPIGNPAVIAHPELLPEEVTSSSIYQQALTRPSVIAYEQEIATDPQPVHDFLAAAERGENWDLYCYQFTTVYADETPYLILRHFSFDGGALSVQTDYAESWEAIDEDDPPYLITDLLLTDYGLLTYHMTGLLTDGTKDWNESDLSVKVVNDLDLYDDAAERQRVMETYLDPIRPSGIGYNTWSSPQELNNLIFVAEDLYRYENEDTPFDHFGSSWPMDFILETLSRYFENVTAEDVIANAERFLSVAHYAPQTDTVYYEGGRGGAPILARVTGRSREGDLLLIDYDCDNIDTGILDYSRRLTVRLREDGSFRYLSNLEQ